jgi:NADH:ubiquinone oxidoreductase subunit 6 (subunit J)
MAEVSFFVAALIALAGAGGTVLLRNPFYAVLALVCHLLGLAALFLLLRAEFVAAAQVIVYAGAVMVLYVFVVAYVGGQDRPLSPRHGPGMRAIALLFAGALLVEIAIAVIGSGISVLGEEGTGWFEGFGSPAEIGRLFLTEFLLAFELASLLLLVAAVGAVILARRRSGLDDPRELSVADLMRSGESGTLTDAERGTLQEAAGPPKS